MFSSLRMNSKKPSAQTPSMRSRSGRVLVTQLFVLLLSYCRYSMHVPRIIVDSRWKCSQGADNQ